MSTIQVFLQNAWSPYYAGHSWPRRSWLRALALSRSGVRLTKLLGDLDVRYENTTPAVAAKSTGKIPADLEHMRTELWRHSGGFRLECGASQWDQGLRSSSGVVVGCGKQAETALAACWSGPLLIVPHPAARVLTDALYDRGYEILRRGLRGRVALRQARGHVVSEDLTA